MLEESPDSPATSTLAARQWLFREGDPADGVYVVRIGHLEVVHEWPRAASAINTLTRGAVLGELALLSHSARSASVRALRDTELLRIDTDAVSSRCCAPSRSSRSASTRVLSTQLQASRAIPAARRARPVTIALRAGSAGVPLMSSPTSSAGRCARGGRSRCSPRGDAAGSGNAGSGAG